MLSFQNKNRAGNANKILLLVIGIIILGLFSASYLIVGDTNIETTKTPPTKTVLIPIQHIEAGTALEDSMFRVETLFSGSISDGVLNNLEQIRGFYSTSFIASGTPLDSAYVTAKRPVNQIQANIPDGFRAVSLAVDPTTSVEGWARPGAKVDVVLAASVGGKPAVRVLVQNAKVLSAGRQVNNEKDNDKDLPVTVTLLVSSDEAGRIQLGSSTGTLSLVLRGDEDLSESLESLTVTLDSIIGGDSTPQINPQRNQGQVKVGGQTYEVVNGELKSKN